MADRLVVVGGDAAGMSAASQVRRRQRHLEIVVLEKGQFTSYSACGIPYLVGGEIGQMDQLVARSPEEFRERQLIDVRLGQEVIGVDMDTRRVQVRDHARERSIDLPFDQLLIATGARPIRPDLPGIDSDWVRGVQNLSDAERLLQQMAAYPPRQVVVVGGGYIGLEMAEAFVRHGATVTLIEGSDQVMRTLDADMAELVESALRRHSIDVRLGERVQAFDNGTVITDKGRHKADLVVLGVGVEPNATLAEQAGATLGVRGAIKVDQRQRTDVDGVWAAGDCAESFHRVSRRPVHIALGTVANKQGRVAGINLGGGYATFPGVVGTAITRICQTEIARTGLNEAEATRAGFDYLTARIETTTRAGYLADAPPMTVKLLVEQGTARVLGGQIVGGDGAAKRIDTLATALTAKMDATDLVDLDLAYAPPFSSVWDPVQVAAREALRLLREGA